MGKLTFKIHPLFIIFGLYFAFTGKVFSFLTYAVCACAHEFGHSITAEKLGYKLKNATLMPYGAVVSGDMDGMTLKEEAQIVAAGPLFSLSVGFFFLALWWAFPNLYPYTSLAAEANFALGVVNLLPAFPLDGGRLLLCLLSREIGRVKATKITKGAGFFLAFALLGLFVYSLFKSANFSILFFALFVIFGVADKSSADAYIRTFDALSPFKTKKTREIKELAVAEGITVKKLYGALTDGYLYRLRVFSSDGQLKRTIEPSEIVEFLSSKRPNDKI